MSTRHGDCSALGTQIARAARVKERENMATKVMIAAC